VFTALRTSRLLIRPVRAEDAADLAERRNDPQVARYQGYALPYSREQAEQQIQQVLAMEGPQNEQWWMAIIADRATGRVLGDVAIRLSWEGRTAEIGYTLAPRYWGRGYASEAVEALLEYLFERLRVTRVFGMLHPDNVPSALVLERCGFGFEGHTRSSYWVGSECSDDWIYGLTRPDWEGWRHRPRRSPQEVSLGRLSAADLEAVLALQIHRTQEAFAGRPACWFADALVPAVVAGRTIEAEGRAVIADGEVVGWLVLSLGAGDPPELRLLRLAIDRVHQRRGIGKRVLELLAEECRVRGATALVASWEEGRGSPGAFFLRHGFEPVGRSGAGRTQGRRCAG
jgi:RimJ/RimL family protein N-acetyltransferase/predicted N-acetyltransferase YhbS